MTFFDTNLVVNLFNLLTRVETALAGRQSCSEAIKSIQALSAVYDTFAGLDETARSAGLQGLSLAISPLQGNGIGDAVIWPALRKSGLHVLCEELSTQTNAVRASLYADRQVPVQVAESQESKVEGLKAFFKLTYGDMDESSLITALDDVVMDAGEAALSDANNGGLDGQLAFLVRNGWSPVEVQAAAAKVI